MRRSLARASLVLVNPASLPADAEIAPEWDAFIVSVGRPSTQARIKKLLERGLHKPGDVENRLGQICTKFRSRLL
jgi:hypothetical protein